jgi:hypothetical protein
MERSQPSFSRRLLLTLFANIAIVALHIPALARDRAFHTYFGYAHPWQDTTVDFLIFIFLAVAFVAATPAVFQRRTLSRCLAVGLLILPLYVVATFVLWSFRL